MSCIIDLVTFKLVGRSADGLRRNNKWKRL